MPNLTSVERLARFYEDDMNCFVVLTVSYTIDGTKVKAEDVHFVPIEFLSWKCLTIGALGWGRSRSRIRTVYMWCPSIPGSNGCWNCVTNFSSSIRTRSVRSASASNISRRSGNGGRRRPSSRGVRRRGYRRCRASATRRSLTGCWTVFRNALLPAAGLEQRAIRQPGEVGDLSSLGQK